MSSKGTICPLKILELPSREASPGTESARCPWHIEFTFLHLVGPVCRIIIVLPFSVLERSV